MIRGLRNQGSKVSFVLCVRGKFEERCAVTVTIPNEIERKLYMQKMRIFTDFNLAKL